ncbi:hypothetical protein [Nocardia fluminea]|uniref:Uncharacterized protein n=1 Tax=Nocardia fluminea TaxID=134984 RepID=A0A2N3VGW6_9NOCA|nr:hypothetical protein [Nocardia fluminea]PKV80878.1 hypothetical protein ATK86_5315 [Nocardia fluminea]
MASDRDILATALGDAWDDGNATGLDGWTGPGRGAGDVDDEAVRARRREIDATLDGDLAGWRPPARKIADPAELDTLPGRSIVVGHRGKFGTAYQLTSYVGFAQTPMWAGPYDVEKRSTSREVIEREGGVTVLHEPTEEDGQ